jgi:hypothetical protein
MYADVERVRFDAAHHYLRVVQQQGRVMMAAESNEQVAILLHHLRTLVTDLFGGRGTSAVPDGAGFKAGPGFAIGPPAAGESNTRFSIQAGHYWVGGRLCELESSTSFTGQPDFPPTRNPPTTGTFIAYLDAWERHVGVAEEPGLAEAALGGPDSCSRTTLVWQVKLLIPTRGNTVGEVQDNWAGYEADLGLLVNAGRLIADVDLAARDTNPCLAAPSSGYTGGENQLIRVEIHTGGKLGDDPKPTFKWAFDNASVAYRLRGVNGTSVVFDRPPRDIRTGFAAGTRVELLSDHQVLRGEPGLLTTVTEVVDDADDYELTLADGSDFAIGDQEVDAGRWALLRRWDHTSDDLQDDGARLLEEHAPLALAHGVTITFAAPADVQRNQPWTYRSGDYWTIPVRVAPGDVIWPRDAAGNRLPRPPEGVDHSYAPLALVSLNPLDVKDARNFIMPIGARA